MHYHHMKEYPWCETIVYPLRDINLMFYVENCWNLLKEIVAFPRLNYQITPNIE